MALPGSCQFQRVILLALLILLPIGNPSAARDSTDPIVYRLWYRNYDSPAVLAVLRLAFDKTPEYGPYRILRSPEMVQGRALVELQEADDRLITIANVATSPEREDNLYAIPLPIDGGLLGLRVCVVRQDNLLRFRGVEDLDDLVARDISIGQGTHWPDSEILKANGVKVITNTRFETLFNMLQRNRFDCFARGVSEVLFDLERVHDSDLVIEPHLLLAYPMPSYFFVGPDDHDTAQRIQLGLERAISDGSFALHLATYYGRAVESLNLDRRKLLVLENPLLSDDSAPIGREVLETLRRRISNGLARQDTP
ncbi:hypothetical protein ACJO2E_07345 [Marinobacter sp. M1N3S26]|uniref:hypothetical protein n=1 Tax=unclassified Marinobacter TaxID=83889 RepID=UPI00387B8CB9